MQEFTLWEMLIGSSFFIQFLMLGLLLASVISWIVIVQRWFIIHQTRRSYAKFKDKFWSGIDLNQLFQETDANSCLGAEKVVYQGYQSFNRIRQRTDKTSNIIEAVERAMRIALAEEQARLQAGLPLIATIGSVSPHVGLFGTVWGIISAFSSLATSNQATFALVAPGMAEALTTTAMGLFVAIPAVIAYNRYLTASELLLDNYENFADEFAGLLHRNLVGRKTPAQKLAEAQKLVDAHNAQKEAETAQAAPAKPQTFAQKAFQQVAKQQANEQAAKQTQAAATAAAQTLAAQKATAALQRKTNLAKQPQDDKK